MSLPDFLWLCMCVWGASGFVALAHELATSWGRK